MLKKQLLKTKKGVCKVTFTAPAEWQAETINLVGEFNGWDEKAHPMKKKKDGSFELAVDLEKDNTYQFRYLIDGTVWHNDPAADRYVSNPFGGENSVVTCTE